MQQNAKATIASSTVPLKAQIPVHFFSTDFPPSHGGLETYAFKLATELDGIAEVSVALGLENPPQNLPEDRRWHWHRGRGRISAGIWSGLDSLRYQAKATCRIHMQWNTACLSALQRKRGALKQLWICAHGSELIQKNRLTHSLMMTILNQADAVVTGSSFTAKLLQNLGVSPMRIWVNPYGVDIPLRDASRQVQKRDSTWRLLCAHRLVVRKGTGLLLQALSLLPKKNWELTLIGSGEESEPLKKMAHSLGIEKQVHFLGRLEHHEKTNHLRLCDLFVLPSLPPRDNNHIEGLGIGLLEAQAYGVAVLAANTGGIPEAVHAPLTGELFEAGSLEALRTSLQKMQHRWESDPAAYEAMGKCGETWVAEHFPWSANLNRWRDWIQSPPWMTNPAN